MDAFDYVFLIFSFLILATGRPNHKEMKKIVVEHCSVTKEVKK